MQKFYGKFHCIFPFLHHISDNKTRFHERILQDLTLISIQYVSFNANHIIFLHHNHTHFLTVLRNNFLPLYKYFISLFSQIFIIFCTKSHIYDPYNDDVWITIMKKKNTNNNIFEGQFMCYPLYLNKCLCLFT